MRRLLPFAFLLPLAACGGAIDSQTPPASDGASVTGAVLDSAGRGLPGFHVHLGDRTQTTDRDGAFAFDGAPAKYDLVVDDDVAITLVYRGLTSRAPVLRLNRAAGQSDAMVAISIALPTAEDATHHYAFWATSPQSDARNILVFDENGTRTLVWNGPSDAPIALHALAYETDPTGGQPRFTGVAARDAQALAPTSTWTPSFSPVETASLSATIGLPLGATLDWTELRLHVDASVRAPLATLTPASPAVTYTVPRVDGLLFDVAARATGTDGGYTEGLARALAPGADASFALRPIPSFVAPAAGATNIDAKTPLTVDQSSTPTWYQLNDGTMRWITVLTAEPQVTLDDLAALGVAIPAGKAWTWEIARVGDATTIDDAAALGTPADSPPDGSASIASSAQRTFATAP